MFDIDVYDKRDDAEQKAIDYLRSTVFADDEASCPSFLSLKITHESRQEFGEVYDEDLKIFKILFAANDEEINIALWNSIRLYCDDKFYKRDFTDDEYAFLKRRLQAGNAWIYDMNFNKPIVTDRLILRAINESDFKVYLEHFKNDVDFDLYVGDVPIECVFNKYANRKLPTLFAVEEKSTHNVVGCVGVAIDDGHDDVIGELDYYIFDEYRRNGYCKEAVTALIDAVFDNRIVVPKETPYEHVFERETLNIRTVKAKILSVNAPSIKFIESIGFLHERTVRITCLFTDDNAENEKSVLEVKRKLAVDDDGRASFEVYCLTPSVKD